MSEPEPTIPVSPETAQATEMATLMVSIDALRADFLGYNERLNGFEEIIKAPVEIQQPTDPAADPDLVPPSDWKAARLEWRAEAEKMAEAKFEERMAKQAAEADSKVQYEKQLNDEFDRMADEAVKKGFIPAVTTDDFNDPGKAARRELFGYAAKLGTTNLVDVAENLKSLHDSGQRYDVGAGKFVTERQANPGRFAPVGSGSATVGSTNWGIDEKTFQRESLAQLASRAMRG